MYYCCKYGSTYLFKCISDYFYITNSVVIQQFEGKEKKKQKNCCAHLRINFLQDNLFSTNWITDCSMIYIHTQYIFTVVYIDFNWKPPKHLVLSHITVCTHMNEQNSIPTWTNNSKFVECGQGQNTSTHRQPCFNYYNIMESLIAVDLMHAYVNRIDAFEAKSCGC